MSFKNELPMKIWDAHHRGFYVSCLFTQFCRKLKFSDFDMKNADEGHKRAYLYPWISS